MKFKSHVEVVRNTKTAMKKNSNIKGYRNWQSKHKVVNTAICLQIVCKVYLGAYIGNIASWKVMEKCGGTYESTAIETETGLPVKRYLIHIV